MEKSELISANQDQLDQSILQKDYMMELCIHFMKSNRKIFSA